MVGAVGPGVWCVRSPVMWTMASVVAREATTPLMLATEGPVPVRSSMGTPWMVASTVSCSGGHGGVADLLLIE